MGNLAADSVSLAFSVAGTTADQWNVKVSQIPCTANYRYLYCKKWTYYFGCLVTNFQFFTWSCFDHIFSSGLQISV